MHEFVHGWGLADPPQLGPIGLDWLGEGYSGG